MGIDWRTWQPIPMVARRPFWTEAAPAEPIRRKPDRFQKWISQFTSFFLRRSGMAYGDGVVERPLLGGHFNLEHRCSYSHSDVFDALVIASLPKTLC